MDLALSVARIPSERCATSSGVGLQRHVDADVAGLDVHVAEPDGKAQARAVVAPHAPDAVCATDATQARDTTLAERTRHTCDAPGKRE